MPEWPYTHVSYSLNSLKGVYIGDYIGTTIGVIKGDTRSLDYSSCRDRYSNLSREHRGDSSGELSYELPSIL